MKSLSQRRAETVPPIFLPIHKVAFGIATGLVAGVLLFLVTAVYLLRDPQPGFRLGLIAQYFAGYTVSWPGAILGAVWALFSGFVLGWFLAFSRNVGLALMLVVVRRRAEWDQSKDLLDHL